MASTVVSSPTLPRAPNPVVSESDDEADCAATIRVVEYAVKNTFIDFSAADSEPGATIERFRARARSDGDFWYDSPIGHDDSLEFEAVKKMCASESLALSEAETASLMSPACSDTDQQQTDSDVDEEWQTGQDSRARFRTWTDEEYQQDSAAQQDRLASFSQMSPMSPLHGADKAQQSSPTPEFRQMLYSTSAMEFPQNQLLLSPPLMWVQNAGFAWSCDQQWASLPSATLPPILGGRCGGNSTSASQLEATAAQLAAMAKEVEAAAARAHEAAERSASPTEGGSVSSPRRSSEDHTDEKPTTVMLRNLPNDYTRDMILQLLDQEGFRGKYDFVYIPIDFHRRSGLGYAFINLVAHDDVSRVWQRFEGFKDWAVESHKVCEVAWGEPLQGLVANVNRFRNCPVMHEDVPDEFKPAIFKSGFRIPFPAPTKKLRKPRLKHRPNAEVGRDVAAHCPDMPSAFPFYF